MNAATNFHHSSVFTPQARSFFSQLLAPVTTTADAVNSQVKTARRALTDGRKRLGLKFPHPVEFFISRTTPEGRANFWIAISPALRADQKGQKAMQAFQAALQESVGRKRPDISEFYPEPVVGRRKSAAAALAKTLG